jgi:hypothetical protein
MPTSTASQSAPHGIFDGLIGLAAHVHLAMGWNGKRVTDVAEVLPEEIPSLAISMSSMAAHGAAEERLIEQHGLAYVLVEGTPTSDGMAWEQLVLENGVLQRLEVNEQGLQSFGGFYQAHQDYLRAVVNDFDSWGEV